MFELRGNSQAIYGSIWSQVSMKVKMAIITWRYCAVTLLICFWKRRPKTVSL